jgi:DNA-binding MarR family transcriptional regulator
MQIFPGYNQAMNEPRWLDESEMRAWLGFLRAHAELVYRLDRELEAAHGLSLAEYEVLAFLSEAPGGRMRPSELARQSRISPSALTRRIDRLEKRGLVRRERCPDDARGAYAVLCREGRKRLVAAAPTHVRGVRAHFVDRLDPAQLETLAAALEAVPGHEDGHQASGCAS